MSDLATYLAGLKAGDTAPMREATRDFKRLKPANGKFYDAPLRGRR